MPYPHSNITFALKAPAARFPALNRNEASAFCSLSGSIVARKCKGEADQGDRRGISATPAGKHGHMETASFVFNIIALPLGI
eukprot:754575-Hanusia_phi.AAC.8